MGAYLMMFASMGAGLPFPFINLVAAAIYYRLNRDKGRFVRFHLLQSLWSQIPITVLNSIAVVWSIRNFIYDITFSNFHLGFIAFLLVLNLVYFIFSIIAALEARKGRLYYFLFFGKLAFLDVFRKHVHEVDFVPPHNQTPKF